MHRTLVLTLLLYCGVCSTYESSGPFGCNKQLTCPPTNCYTYRAPTEPEYVLGNLILSYQRREIEPYARLLHKDFVFRFQSGDEPEGLGREFWTHDEDSTGTQALFHSPEVTDIFIDLSFSNAEPAEELDLAGAMKIRVHPMKITVDDVRGTTYLVEGDIQDLFFTTGDGADSTTWYLLEWRDIAGGGGAGPTDKPGSGVVPTTWGQLKQMF